MHRLAVCLALAITAPVVADEKWWSLRPLNRPAVPSVAGDVRNPIDAFVLAKLRAKGFDFAPEADRRVLHRRVTIDLTGLPPTPDEVAAFLADTSTNAYERLIDRLLASPQYGERWARHWLDVAHYADTHGHDQDRPRPNAWPYRDYLIRSFNADKPYDRFVQEQIAGDAMFPGDPDAVAATGFLAAGPWDESSLRDIQEDTLDRRTARYLDRDDIVTSVMSTFAGVTVGCARCHDHKFDPVPQDDYFALQAVFAGVDKAERTYQPDPAVARRREDLAAELRRFADAKGKVVAELLTPARQADALAFAEELTSRRQKWIVLDPASFRSANGAELKELDDHSVLSGGTRPDRDVVTIVAEAKLPSVTGLRLEVLCDDSLPQRGPGRQDNGNFHLSEVRVTANGNRVELRNAVADFDQDGWAIPRAIDGNAGTAWGIYPAVGQPHLATFEFAEAVTGPVTLTVELDQLHGGGHLVGRVRLAATDAARPFALGDKPVSPEVMALIATQQRSELQQCELARLAALRKAERELASLPPPANVYAVTKLAAVRDVQVLRRGEASKPIRPASPGALSCVTGLSHTFAATGDEGDRRTALARWLTDDRHPLTWRVAANRVWHYHFGRGIVDTPNDFGRMGGTPSHPELLEWLATEFRDNGKSLKHLHRLILTSRTYRQACSPNAKAAAIDGDNRLLWRMNRGRLDAESVRDAVLLASGKLDATMYGPPAQQFNMKPGIHVTPEVDYERFDVDAPASRRRAVYRFVFRTRPDPLLETLDCPDASQSAPSRSASVSPLQALALWNDKFQIRYSEHLAALTESAAADTAGRVRFAFTRVVGRAPTEAEAKALTVYADRHGMANACRVMLNMSEFLFVD